MIASVLRLNRSDIKGLKIKDAYGIHRAVYSLFPKIEGENRDFLYVDKGGDERFRQILILSKRKPITPDFGTVNSKNVPDSFLSHDYYGFEIRLNPTKRDKKSGKTVAVRGDKSSGQTDREALILWFIDKTPGLGFEVVVDQKTNTPILEVTDIGVQEFPKDGHKYTHGKATFIGKLKVTHRENFTKSFAEGIGRAKGFGFGLFQIVPLKNQETLNNTLTSKQGESR